MAYKDSGSHISRLTADSLDWLPGWCMQGAIYFFSEIGVVYTLPPEDRDSRRVSSIGADITAAALQGRGGGDWQHMLDKQLRFRVITDPDDALFRNAGTFSLPNGTVYITMDMLHSLDDGQLGAVLAREVAHIMARHSAEQAVICLKEMPSQLLAEAVEGGCRLLKSDAGRELRDKLEAIKLAAEARQQKHSLLCESDADLVGMQLMAEARCDPREMITYLSALSKQDGRRWILPGVGDSPLKALGAVLRGRRLRVPGADKRARAERAQQALPSAMEVYRKQL
jgi:predicted Zn-dependent protease